MLLPHHLFHFTWIQMRSNNVNAVFRLYGIVAQHFGSVVMWRWLEVRQVNCLWREMTKRVKKTIRTLKMKWIANFQLGGRGERDLMARMVTVALELDELMQSASASERINERMRIKPFYFNTKHSFPVWGVLELNRINDCDECSELPIGLFISPSILLNTKEESRRDGILHIWVEYILVFHMRQI